jgi:hypothetical protein
MEELAAVWNGVKRGSESTERDNWFVAIVIPVCGVRCFAIPLILPILSSLSPPSSDDPLSSSLDEMGSFPTPEAFPWDRVKI